MNELGLRIGDAERDQAAATLGEHFAQGRLTLEEHHDRLDVIWSARTRGDLLPVFADLPGPYARRTSPPSVGRGSWSSGPRAFRHAMPTPLLVVVALLLAFTVATHLPFLILGALAWVFVVSRHRSRRRSGHLRH
ncbi:MAG: DUF1707 domain-containing protein [Nocardioides sp.]|nr:DUF1707 domain-containing protein [Nocardioides sp.]